MEAFARQHRPAAIVYDIPPYHRHSTFMNHMRHMPELAGIPFIVTTTNARRLQEIVGTDAQVFAIVGKPYDLDQIVNAVTSAIDSHV
jgi:CheY-like chemotaxis protein